MIFIEMAVHVGDVKNYYISSKFSENLILPPIEKKQCINRFSRDGYLMQLRAEGSLFRLSASHWIVATLGFLQ
jgi:hypothetical protein